MNTYFISGLGADKRIFSKIVLDSQIKIIHLDWIQFSKGQSLISYAEQLGKKIDTTTPFVIVGVSFGGMIATELAKILKPAKTIIISSIVFNNQFPWIYKLFGKLNLLKFIPAWLLKSSNKLTQNYYFGTKLLDDKELLRKIVEETDPKFLKWAIGSILKWKNNIRPENLIHIHGDNDKIFPLKNVNPDFVINGGSHFMVYQKAEKISELMNNLIIK